MLTFTFNESEGKKKWNRESNLGMQAYEWYWSCLSILHTSLSPTVSYHCILSDVGWTHVLLSDGVPAQHERSYVFNVKSPATTKSNTNDTVATVVIWFSTNCHRFHFFTWHWTQPKGALQSARHTLITSFLTANRRETDTTDAVGLGTTSFGRLS